MLDNHHSTTYINAAYSYRQSSVVCLSVSLSVMMVSRAKIAKLIAILAQSHNFVRLYLWN